jgi:cytochrome b subunit of formate dehydrogenase
MELWRRAANPWGQEVLIGVSWDLMWAAVIAAGLFLVGHAIWVKTRPSEEHATPSEAPPGLPERIERHSLGARIFHWTMSASMLVLLFTAFAPVMGWQFPWVTVHWIAGVVLIATVVYHVIHAIGWQDFWSMFQLGVSEGVATLRHVLSPKAPAPPKAGKYPFDHRLYHHAIVVVALSAIVTGALMMVRIDTPFWTRNPYLFSDSVWGVMYVVHGLAGVSLILLVAAHIYFALRPEKHWMTWSMIRGWIDREHYLEHFDPDKWDVTDSGARGSVEGGTGALADASVSARRDD